jgi:GAF domain-containing protein
MAESIYIPSETKNKKDRYEYLIPQIFNLIENDGDLISVMANTASALHHAMHFLWTGFYIVRGQQLVLGPFQGPVACSRIAYGKGVCGTSWKRMEAIIVPDVEAFPGHIACSSLSRSEIVLPFVRNGKVEWVLDVDSQNLNEFDETDLAYLSLIIQKCGTSCDESAT